MSVLPDVVATLDAAEIGYALIAAAAMAVHGVSRATAAVDFLTVDTEVLKSEFWNALESPGVSIRVLKGDVDDPLAGSVRLTAEDDRIVDVVVGRDPSEVDELVSRLPSECGTLWARLRSS